MKQIKTLKIAVIALVVLNTAFMAFHFTRTKKGPPHRHPKAISEMISKKLNFSESQKADYQDLIEIHQENTKRLIKEKNNAKRKLYRLLDGKNDHENGQAELIALLGGIQVEMEALHYEHFNRIRQLCTEDQLDDFKELQKKLVYVFSPKPPPKK